MPSSGMRRQSRPLVEISESEDHQGQRSLSLLTSRARLDVGVTQGPRISFFGPREGKSLLFWDEQKKYKRNDWWLRGGHRVWHTRPGADEAEETYMADNGPCQVERTDNGVWVMGETHPVFRLRKMLCIRAVDALTFTVENHLVNDSALLWSGGVWGLTCTLPKRGDVYGVPLGDGSDWDTYSVVIPRRWAGHESPPDDPQVKFGRDTLWLEPKGVECKRMVQAPQGIIGMTSQSQKLSFLKQTAYHRGLTYPLGCNVALYVGPKNFMVEMEFMGPEQSVKPKGTLVLSETWALREPVRWSKLTTAEAQRLF